MRQARELKLSRHLWEQSGTCCSFILDNCGYKLVKRYTSKSNRNEYLQTANHVAVEMEWCPPFSLPPYKNVSSWPKLWSFAKSLLLSREGGKESTLLMECWSDLQIMVWTTKRLGIPSQTTGIVPRIEVLDPVNLSERRVSSLGHVENIKFIVDKYIEHVQGTGAPITFVYGDQQVWETLWKLIRRSKKV